MFHDKAISACIIMHNYDILPAPIELLAATGSDASRSDDKNKLARRTLAPQPGWPDDNVYVTRRRVDFNERP